MFGNHLSDMFGKKPFGTINIEKSNRLQTVSDRLETVSDTLTVQNILTTTIDHGISTYIFIATDTDML